VTKVIRNKLNNVKCSTKGPIDAFTIIYQSGLARKLPWRAQVEEAVEGESDEFWEKVCT